MTADNSDEKETYSVSTLQLSRGFVEIRTNTDISSDGTRNMFKLARRPFSKYKKMVKFKYLCVYVEKGITAAEALKRDGRFTDDLGYFELVNIDDELTGSFIKQGTGFVLFDNFVLTNAHLFDYWVKSNSPNWREFVNVTVVFNFEDQESDRNNLSTKVFVGNDKLDYVILKLETEKVPPGLLKRFGPVPSDGEACVIGHPGGCEEFCSLCEINQQIKNDPFQNIYVTYNTLMYHGSSGSPVFDAEKTPCKSSSKNEEKLFTFGLIRSGCTKPKYLIGVI
ncbi:serine protease FAM111A-like [Simochromis diagramma]|uniref:serine protease FAM111A-like n=1 Tax=Simochromis diagramma TaxID=43689 RepID=UPI001A7EB25C|nr:serine protease FAM111A-like [Simochromis diagramma]